jgi:hypothetical protein
MSHPLAGSKPLRDNSSGDRPERFARGFAQNPRKQRSDATAPLASTDPDLARVVDAWPTLQEAIRYAVLKLIS